MKTINQTDFTKALERLFRETFEGMDDVTQQMFLMADTGIFATLASFDAAQASAEINGTTIAAHSEHARFYIQLLDNYLNKDMNIMNFNDSWKIQTVDEAEWEALRENFAATYRKTRETFDQFEEWTIDSITVAMGMIAHTAYHLGAIRQMAKNL